MNTRPKLRYCAESIDIVNNLVKNATLLGECDIEQFYTDMKYKRYKSREGILYIKSRHKATEGCTLTQPVRISEEEYIREFKKSMSLRKHRKMYRLGTAMIDVDIFVTPQELILIDIVDAKHSYEIPEGLINVTGCSKYKNQNIARRR